MMTLSRSALAMAVLLAAASTLPAQTRTATPQRKDLEDLRSALEAAVARTGPAGVFHYAHRSGHAYRLKGYGAIIVLAPRVFPPRMVVRRVKPVPPPRRAATADPRIVIETADGTFDVAIPDLGDLQREMEAQMAMQAAALREMESTQQLWAHGHEEELRRHLRVVEQQAEAFRLEAERARRQMEREVWTRLAPPASPEAALPVAAVPPVPPVPPPVPAVAPGVPEPPEPPPPPWRFWFDAAGESEAPEMDPDAFVAAVREAVAAALGSYRRPLSSLRPEDVVAVAVDFVPDRPFRKSQARTLLVRVRARDLQDRQAGRLTAAELRQRLDFEED